MTRKTPNAQSSGPLSRKRTAEMLRALRALTRQVKMLKARLDAETEIERDGHALRPRRRSN